MVFFSLPMHICAFSFYFDCLSHLTHRSQSFTLRFGVFFLYFKCSILELPNAECFHSVAFAYSFLYSECLSTCVSISLCVCFAHSIAIEWIANVSLWAVVVCVYICMRVIHVLCLTACTKVCCEVSDFCFIFVLWCVMLSLSNRCRVPIFVLLLRFFFSFFYVFGVLHMPRWCRFIDVVAAVDVPSSLLTLIFLLSQ